MDTKAKAFSLHAAGKGVNAAKAIAGLRERVTVFGFVGEDEAPFFKKLEDDTLKIRLQSVPGKTRTNITIMDAQQGMILHTRLSGYSIDAHDLDVLLAAFGTAVQAGDIVVLSGSLPPGLPDDAYRSLIDFCHGKGAKTILDTSGSCLKKGLGAKPFAVKPNLEELQELTGCGITCEQDIIQAAKSLNDQGIECVFVSRGTDGVLLCQKNHAGYWKAGVALDPARITGASVGCGDALVGGIAMALKRGASTENMLKIAAACGAAHLLQPGPGICTAADVGEMLQKTFVKKIEL